MYFTDKKTILCDVKRNILKEVLFFFNVLGKSMFLLEQKKKINM